ncbi:MAG TPA: RHS repeat-associated core domain-containing protein [Candidatus Dormibacteraeota bacterium]|nr:RHS repeat-associated core domain-containing protein [Candidatus Dormibacteraeota bacterium]
MINCRLTRSKDGIFYPLTGCSGNPPGDGTSIGTIEDPNGNKITTVAGLTTTDTDTLGRTISLVGIPTTSIQYKDSNGTVRAITINYTSVTISCSLLYPSGWTQPSGTLGRPSSVVLPDGLTYTFQYNGCGDLAKITYPSGGYTRYDYDTQDYTQWVVFPDGTESAVATDIQVSAKHVCRAPALTLGATSTGTGNTCPVAEDTTTYVGNANGNNVIGYFRMTNNTQTSVTDALGNLTVYQFTNIGQSSSPPLETSRTIYQGSSTLLRTIQTSYLDSQGYQTIYPTKVTTILPNGLQSQVQTDYAGYGNPKEVREYAYGSGAPGSTVIRRTDYLYGACYRKTSEIVYDGSNNQIASTTYELDNYTAGITASGAVQHDSAFGTSYTARCNVTAVNRWRNTDGATLTMRHQYDDAGNVVSATDPLSHTTTTSYADVWGNSACAPTGGNAAAFPTHVTDPAGLINKSSYNSCTGTLASVTDPNLQVSSVVYDLMDRATEADFPDGGQKTLCYSEVSGSSCYNSSYPLNLVAKQKITSSITKTSTTVLDGLSRVSQTQLNSDPDGVSFVDTTYDGNEQKATVSNPHLSTTSPTDGTTTYQYDGLGRATTLIPPDGTGSANNITTTYDIVLSTTPPANCTTATDQAGKTRKSCSDALGRLTQVFEDPGGLSYETDYQYDLLNNLVRVDQKGSAPSDSTQWRTRTFAYNSLSQLLCSANPEMAIVTCPNPDNGSYTPGTVRYAYDNDGNLATKTSPKPNQTSSSVTVQTTYTYDLDNRLTTKSYNDGSTPMVQFAYDASTLSGCTTTPPSQTDSYPKGRRTSMCDASGAASWSHDKMGRVLHERRTIGSVKGDYDNDTFNLDGSVATVTSLGYGVTYTYNAAGRPITAKNSADPFNYVTSANYAPFGGLTAMSMGAQPITISNSYNNRLQPTTLSASGAATIMSLSYDFHLGTADNGNVFQIVNNRDGNRTQNFIYDSQNRIQQAWTNGSNWGETYGSPASNPGIAPTNAGIDSWGNLFQRSAVNGKTLTEPLSCVADKQNHLTTCSMNYDAAGNMTSYGTANYTYDAENQLIATASTSYIYDGDGKRVEKCTQGTSPGICASNATGTLYWTGTTSDPFVETDLAGNVVETYIFFNGKRIARREPTTPATVHYYFSDHLGTHSLITDAVGTMSPHPQEESDFYPYGGEIPITTGDSNHYKFTGKERDSESGLDNFGVRFDASNLGRFMSPDEGALNLGNPQSLGRYSYTINNPLRYIDEDGLDVTFANDKLALQTFRLEQQSFTMAEEVYDAMTDHRIDVQVVDRGVRQNDQHSQGDTEVDATDPSITRVTIKVNPYFTPDDQVEHEWGHEHDVRIMGGIQWTIKAQADKEKYYEPSDHDKRPTEQSANAFKDRVNAERKRNRELEKRLKKEEKERKKGKKKDKCRSTNSGSGLYDVSRQAPVNDSGASMVCEK